MKPLLSLRARHIKFSLILALAFPPMGCGRQGELLEAEKISTHKQKTNPSFDSKTETKQQFFLDVLL